MSAPRPRHRAPPATPRRPGRPGARLREAGSPVVAHPWEFGRDHTPHPRRHDRNAASTRTHCRRLAPTTPATQDARFGRGQAAAWRVARLQAPLRSRVTAELAERTASLPLLCRQSSGPRDFCSRVKQQPHPPCHNRRREAEVSVAAVLVLPGGPRQTAAVATHGCGSPPDEWGTSLTPRGRDRRLGGRAWFSGTECGDERRTDRGSRACDAGDARRDHATWTRVLGLQDAAKCRRGRGLLGAGGRGRARWRGAAQALEPAPAERVGLLRRAGGAGHARAR